MATSTHATHDTHSTPAGSGWSPRRIAGTALFCALSLITSFIEIPIFPPAPWLEYDPSCVVALVAGLAFGPATGTIVVVLSWLVHLVFQFSPWGVLMAIAANVSLVVPCSLIARKVSGRRGLGLVFQNPDDQIVTSVVADDVAFGPENLGLPRDEIRRRVERELKRVALTDYARADPSRMSGGQRQRVCIAGALAMEPQVLVLDEPSSLLDVRGREAILRVMSRLTAAGTTLVHVTHFMDEALQADRAIVMRAGRVVLDGAPREVFCSKNAELIDELGLEMPFELRLERARRALTAAMRWRGLLSRCARESAARSWGRPARASPRCCGCSAASRRRTPAPSRSRARRRRPSAAAAPSGTRSAT